MRTRGGRALCARESRAPQSRGRDRSSLSSPSSPMVGSQYSSGEGSRPLVPSTPTSPHSSNGEQPQETDVTPFPLHEMHCRKTHTEIKAIMKSRFSGPWRSYRNVPETERDHWFDEFRLTHPFADSAKKKFRKLFDKCGSQGLKKMLQTAREENVPPEYIAENDFKDLQTYWASPEFKKLSAKGKKARSSESCKNNPYCGGSITTADHKKRLRKILGRRIFMRELYGVTWKRKKTREWSGPRIQACYEKFIAARQKARDEVNDESQPIDEDEIFMEYFGPPQCGKILGLGSLSSEVQTKFRGDTSTSSIHCENLEELIDNRIKVALTTSVRECIEASVQTVVRAAIEENDRTWMARFAEYRNSLALQNSGLPTQSTLAPSTSIFPFQQFPFSQMAPQGQSFQNGAMSFTDWMNFGSSMLSPPSRN
ncbi:unnamed protein product [Cuscuta epithymum]|uniref:Uncharacterized protein n=1 Tax=Cuscuta epithymum TaxID=186058 RepID=A0AAV0FQN5_9ASTE|nr:unnamed protein product [Cuscuta epithymum]